MAAKPKSKAKSKRGGRRAGAGRKSKAATKLRADLVAEADRAICDDLPALVRDLLRLAHGGYERIEERWEPAALVLVDRPLLNADGTPMTGPRGGALSAKQTAFPGLKPDELVLVSRTRSIADADRAAIMYALDRVLGKPKQALEMSGPNGGSIALSIEQAVAKVYGGDTQDPTA